MIFQIILHFMGLAADPLYQEPPSDMDKIAGQDLKLQLGKPERRAYRHICRMVRIAEFVGKATLDKEALNSYVQDFEIEKRHLQNLKVTVPNNLSDLKTLQGKLLYEVDKNG